MAVPVWALSLPLPAIIMISVGLYMILVAAVLWCHYCLKAKCDPQCSDCCASFSPCEYCLVCAQSCDCLHHLCNLVWTLPAPLLIVRCGIVPVPASLQSVTPSTASALRSSLSRRVDGRKKTLLILKDALEAPTPSDT